MDAHDTQHLDLPSELWFKIIALVLSDSIYLVCCSPAGGGFSWDRHAFGTLRLVSKFFSHTAIKVADFALTGKHRTQAMSASGEDDELMNVDGDERGDEMEKLKLIYDRFKLINSVQFDRDAIDSFARSGASLLSAYYGYVQLIKNCKALFSLSIAGNPNLPTINMAAPSAQKHLELMEKIHLLFSTAFKNVLSMLDIMTVPEMVERLRRDVERDWKFIMSGLEIVYRCAQAVNRRNEWESSSLSTEFTDFLDDLYSVMRTNAELYASALDHCIPGEFPAISDLPGVQVAMTLIVSHSHHHQALAGLVSSWG